MRFYCILKDGEIEYPVIQCMSSDYSKVKKDAYDFDLIYVFEGDEINFTEGLHINEQPGFKLWEGTLNEYFSLECTPEFEEIENLNINWDKFNECEDLDIIYETDYEEVYKEGKLITSNKPNVRKIIDYIKEHCLVDSELETAKTINDVLKIYVEKHISPVDAINMILKLSQND